MGSEMCIRDRAHTKRQNEQVQYVYQSCLFLISDQTTVAQEQKYLRYCYTFFLTCVTIRTNFLTCFAVRAVGNALQLQISVINVVGNLIESGLE